MKILIAEDDFISRKVIKKMLEGFGECDIAVDGAEALHALTDALNSGQPYDMVCLDIKMPELTGLEVLKKLRELEDQKGRGGLSGAKVIMTTGLEDSSSVLGAFRAGCEAYIIKPISQEKLTGKIKELGF